MIVDATIINKTPYKRWIKGQKNLKVVEKSVENRKSELQSGFVNFIRGSLCIRIGKAQFQAAKKMLIVKSPHLKARPRGTSSY
jgi:hypothetical protein